MFVSTTTFWYFWFPTNIPEAYQPFQFFSTEALSDSDFLKRREPAGYHGSVMGAINKNPSHPASPTRCFSATPSWMILRVRGSKVDSSEWLGFVTSQAIQVLFPFEVSEKNVKGKRQRIVGSGITHEVCPECMSNTQDQWTFQLTSVS